LATADQETLPRLFTGTIPGDRRTEEPAFSATSLDRLLRSPDVPEGRSEKTALDRDARYRWALALGDALAVVLAGAVVLAPVANVGLALPAVAVPLAAMVLGQAAGLYRRDQYRLSNATLDEVPALLQVATVVSLLTWLGEHAFVDGKLGHGQVALLWASLFLLLPLCRTGTRAVTRRFTPSERCLVVGDPRSADSLQAKLTHGGACKATIVGRVPLEGDRRRLGNLPVLGTTEMLGLTLAEHEIDRVIIAPRSSDSEDILHVIRTVKAMGAKVSVVPRMFEIVGSSVEFDNVDGIQLLGLRRGGLSAWSRIVKRGLDIGGSAFLLVAGTPVLLGLALAIWLDSPGPVFFRQRRIGRNGEEFEIVKFRTMIADAEKQKAALRAQNEAQGLFKIADDPRITRVGRFLRRSSLDELPQLFNVLRGQMSLVGPRPLVPDEDEMVEGWHRARLSLTPGMTGFWQICGSSRIPMHEMVKIDYLYGTTWSLWLDMKILLRTVPYALARRGL
jgi:exopolysaccharide biosynthesis polyprenyl glycosylphosphotransferase